MALKISVVVPAFNEERLLARSLASMREAMQAFHERGWESELVVCDNNSSDRTADIARAAGARVVFEPVNQIARARNAGARASTGDWLVFVDADSFPTRELFADAAREIASGGCVAGGSTVRLDCDDLPAKLIVGVWNALSRSARWAAGSFVFCEAAGFREVGGFNEALYASEEVDLSRRVKRLARRTRRRFTILHEHPLRTSGRKVHLYSWREMAAFGLRTLLGGGKTLRSRDACFTWYDGRR